jgi:hypothetical protein
MFSGGGLNNECRLLRRYRVARVWAFFIRAELTNSDWLRNYVLITINLLLRRGH